MHKIKSVLSPAACCILFYLADIDVYTNTHDGLSNSFKAADVGMLVDVSQCGIPSCSLQLLNNTIYFTDSTCKIFHS